MSVEAGLHNPIDHCLLQSKQLVSDREVFFRIQFATTLCLGQLWHLPDSLTNFEVLTFVSADNSLQVSDFFA